MTARARRTSLCAMALAVLGASWAAGLHAQIPAGIEDTAAAVVAAATVAVDAREAPRGIMSAHLELPVAAGPLTLVYPKWLAGRASPSGPLTSLGRPGFP